MSETKDISFTVARGDAEVAKKMLEENQEASASTTSSERPHRQGVHRGRGHGEQLRRGRHMFEALSNAGININMISTSEIKVSVLVDERDADRA